MKTRGERLIIYFMGRKGGITKEVFLYRSKKVHGDSYDYSETEIDPTSQVRKHPPVKIKCRKHNYIFYEYPNKHYQYKKYSHRENVPKLPICCQRGNNIIFLNGGYLNFLNKVEQLGQIMNRDQIAKKLGYTTSCRQALYNDVKKSQQLTGKKIKIKHSSLFLYEGQSGLIKIRDGLSLFEDGIEIKRKCTECGKMKDKEEGFYSKSTKEPHVKRRKCKECWISNHGGDQGWKGTEAYIKWRKEIYVHSEGYKSTLKKTQKRIQETPVLKMAGNLRCRVGDAFRTAKKLGFPAMKKTKTLDLLGAESWDQVKEHLESKFLPGMSWENHGEWHIDHNKPVDYFIKNKDFTDEKVQKECFHYLNLQPLWAVDNLRKNNKMPVD